MEGKHRALLLLTCLALLVTSLNGIVDLSVKLRQTFTASAINDYDERLTVKVRCNSGRPSFAWWLAWSTLKATCSWHEGLWRLAWRVGGNMVTTVENAVTITVTGSNIETPVSVDYYIEARKPDGTVLGKTLQASGVPCYVGEGISASTGSVSINTHLSSLGLSTTCDQTVDYYVYVKVTAVGLISGRQLVVELGPIKFDTITYDYIQVTNYLVYASTSDGWQGYVKEGSSSAYPIQDHGDEVLFGGIYSAWFSFPDVDIPQGATILSAHLGFISADNSYGNAPLKIVGYKGFTWYGSKIDTYDDYWRLDRTSAYVMWTPGSWYDGNAYNSTDISAIVQEIVNLGRWGSGSDMTIFVQTEDTSSSARRVDGVLFGAEVKYYLTRLYVSYSTSTASWYPLPLSVVSLPIGRQLFWGLVIGLVCFAAIVKLTPLLRRGGGRKR